MRSPNVILENLQKHSLDANYKYERLYRNLYNEDFYLQALQNIYSNKGAMTPGIDGLTLDGYGMERINKIIETIKNHSYQPQPVRREYIKKKNGKLRPLGISSSDDKLVEEVIKMILETIYDPTFSKYSHGFRPNKSCHTALLQVQNNFTAVRWFIEGDIKSYFDTIDHHTLINILRKRIKDESFIELIWKFLKAGYMDKWEYNATYSGIAQGSGISPILANIYLNELDVFIEKYKATFDKGNSAKTNENYRLATIAHACFRDKARRRWNKMSNDEKEESIKTQNELRNKMLKIPSKDQMDPNYRRLQYTRYADDFIIGIIGSKEDAKKVKQDIKDFLEKQLKLELSEEKTLITNSRKKAKFLGYEITVCRDNALKKIKGVGTKRNYNYRVKLYVPKEAWTKKLLQYEVLKIVNKNGQKKVWKPLQKDSYINLNDAEIVTKYNQQIRGLYNYYSLASNVSVLNKFRYVMEYSMYKTFASKYRITMTKAKLKYTNNKEFKVPYKTSRNETKYVTFYNNGFRKSKKALGWYVDIKAEKSYIAQPKELYFRYKKSICECCGNTEEKVIVHAVKSMNDIDETTTWGQAMKSKRRKTLIVCETCYKKIQEYK